MEGKKLIKFLLLVVVFDLLLFTATDGSPWWSRRRRQCSSSRPSGVAWVNTWHQYFAHRCPNRYFMNYWRSQHRNCKEDRIHYFLCGYDSIPFSDTDCAWTSYQNDFDQPLLFKCQHNGFITGVASEYSGHHKDRRFSFRCCHKHGYIQHTCKYTPYLNNWDQEISYTVPHGYHLVGVHSYHHSHYEDRRWKFEICQITKLAGK